VKRQPTVTKGIGALGLSTGAEVLLTSAAQDKRIKTVVAEGAQARTMKELGLLPVGSDKFVTLEEYALGEMPDAPHTGGLATHPVEYERRVVGFLDRALLGRS
jgi:hypothetical protein